MHSGIYIYTYVHMGSGFVAVTVTEENVFCLRSLRVPFVKRQL